MITTIRVTEEHIRKGRAKDCRACPVALAIEDVVRPDLMVWVDSKSVELIDPGLVECNVFGARITDEVADRIQKFDFDGIMQPFAFDLDIPQEFLRGEPVE
jgi:hypothetical protein